MISKEEKGKNRIKLNFYKSCTIMNDEVYVKI